MIAGPQTHFTLPAELAAAEPPEARGLARDGVRLLAALPGRIEHARFHDLGNYLRPGDLLVVNTSATRAAAVDGAHPRLGAVVVHLSTPLDDGSWLVELRTAPSADKPIRDADAGEIVALPGEGRLRLLQRYPLMTSAGEPGRLWLADIEAPGGVGSLMARHGRPIRYGYLSGQWPLDTYQTVFAAEAPAEPGSAEMPSAGRPFSARLVTQLVSSGVLFASIVLHAGVSSLETHEPPLAERYAVPARTAMLVNWTHRVGGRVVAVGTTVTRALESASRPDGSVVALQGWTDLVVGPDRPARAVDGLVTGMHDPDASHLLLLEAVAGPDLVQAAYDAALDERYLWHEFGDMCLLLPHQSVRRSQEILTTEQLDDAAC